MVVVKKVRKPRATKKKLGKKKAAKKKVTKKSEGFIDRDAEINFDGEGIKMNLYGRSGTGKTTVWSTFPGKTLAILCSGGSKPGELRSINKKDRKRITPHTLANSKDILEITKEQSDTEYFETVVLEHATGLQDLVMKEILGLDELPAQASWGMAKQQDWGQCGLQMKEMLRALLNLSCNVVIVAQEREFNTDSEGDLLMPFVASALTPSVVGWLNPACDYICETFIRQKTKEVRRKIGKKTTITKQNMKGVDYCLRTAPDPVYTTKFRLPKGAELPDVIVDPSYEKIKELIDQGE